MKAVFIILGIAAILFVVVKSRQRRAQATLNPVDSILPNGTMGFMIGDSKAFTLSRIKHLGMATKQELDEYRELSSVMTWAGNLTVAKDMYAHIKDVTFSFNNDQLQQIIITFDKQPDEIAEFWGIVMSRIAKILGEPNFMHDGIAKWNNKISLFYDVMEQKEKWVLNLFIADNI